MALLDDIKVFVRQTGSALDVQWKALIAKALADMEDKGVDPELLELDYDGSLEDPQVLVAVATYCQAHGGFVDNNAASRLNQSYLDQVCHLMHHHPVTKSASVESSVAAAMASRGE